MGWFNEKPHYERLGANGKYPDNYVGPPDVGHYTQMVWQDTTKVGGGKAQYTRGPHKDAWIIVGKYSPGGNVLTKYAYGTPNSGPPANKRWS